MNQHEWKFGDWGRAKQVNNEIVRFVSMPDYNDDSKLTFFLRENGHVQHMDRVVYLPDCDSFDWQPPKPIEPPGGYRLLVDKETIEAGDIALHFDNWVPTSTANIGQQYWVDNFLPMARKIDRYRPFANAAEYKPYNKTCIDVSLLAPRNTTVELDAYCDAGVFGIRFQTSFIDLIPWDRAFEIYKFEDGTPFGVKLDDEAKNQCPLNRDKCKDGCFYPYECAKPIGSGSK